MKTNDDTKIALISKDIGYIQCDISEIKVSLKGLGGVFASKVELAEVAKQTEMRLGILEKANGMMKYVVPMITALFSSGVTFLLIAYLEGVK